MTAAQDSQLPGYWRFLWMFFMQPVSIQSCLKDAGIEDPDEEGWDLWQQGGVARDYLKKSVATCGITLVGVAAGLILFSEFFFGGEIDPQSALIGVVVWGGALGIAWCLLSGVASGVTLGVFFGVTAGITFSTVGPTTGGVLSSESIFTSAAAGGAVGFVAGAAWGFEAGVLAGIVTGLFSGSLQGNLAEGLSGAVAGGASALIVASRLPVYLLEVPLQGLLYSLKKLPLSRTLQCSPVLHHNLSYFPHPFLAQHVLRAAEENPDLARRVLDACSITPGQRTIGQRVLAELQARELEELVRDRRFSSIVELQGTWLPGLEGSDPLLLAFAEVARYLASAEGSSIPVQRLQKLQRASTELALQTRLLRFDDSLIPVPALQAAINELLHVAQVQATNHLPNPFRVKEPLSPEKGREVFRRREAAVRAIESLLGEPGRGCSIALLGPRRTGKTSLLKMLPLLMPDSVCVFFDLQDNPIDSPASFFSALSRRAREQASRERQLTLPDLPVGSPFESGSQWLELLDSLLDSLPGGRRILFCIDEFERLESLFPGSRRELLQLLGLIRATIQHRQRVRILVAGAAPFEELDALWNDHLINAREIRIGFLDRKAAVELLRKPIPKFPDEAVPEEVAQLIYERTGGQPNLVQLYGSLLVTRLNEQDRQQADRADVARVEEDVLVQETSYFRNILQEAPPAARTALINLAHDQSPEIDAATRRWLSRRLLLTDDGRLTMPVFGAWMRVEEGM